MPRSRLRRAEDEIAAWNALVQPRTVEDLGKTLPGGAHGTLDALLSKSVCELAARPIAGRRKVLVIEPHSDDAALSVGGTMLLWRDACEFEVLTVASQSNFTSYFDLEREFFDVTTVSNLRAAEAALMARVIGGRHRALGLPEATLRYRDGDWPLAWYRRHRYSVKAFIGHRSSETELRAWTQALQGVLRDTDAEEVWIPLGIGLHTDHELARNACFAVLLADPSLAERRVIRLYEEVPYAARSPGLSDRIVGALTRDGARLVLESVPVEEVFAGKLRLIDLFGSQFKLHALQPEIEASARSTAGQGPRTERLWTLERLPSRLNPSELWVDAPIVRGNSARLRGWASRHRDARRVRLLLVVPAGRWAEDMRELLRWFPRAVFEVHASSACLAEMEAFTDPRIEVQPVQRRMLSWLRLAVQLALSRPAPTLFLSGARRAAEARRLALMWPLSDSIVLPTMDHMVQSIRAIR